MDFADALRRLEPTADITALGTVRGLDTTLIPARRYQLELIPPVPLPRTLNRALLQTPCRLRDSVRAAGAVLDRVRAEILMRTTRRPARKSRCRVFLSGPCGYCADRHRPGGGGVAGRRRVVAP
jgi:hypothetical protein